MSLASTSSLRQFFHFHMPECCHCLCMRMNKKERIMAACRAQYMEEINIVEHIMQFREIKAQIEEKNDEPPVTRQSIGSWNKMQLRREKTKREARRKRMSVFDDGSIRSQLEALRKQRSLCSPTSSQAELMTPAQAPAPIPSRVSFGANAQQHN